MRASNYGQEVGRPLIYLRETEAEIYDILRDTRTLTKPQVLEFIRIRAAQVGTNTDPREVAESVLNSLLSKGLVFESDGIVSSDARIQLSDKKREIVDLDMIRSFWIFLGMLPKLSPENDIYRFMPGSEADVSIFRGHREFLIIPVGPQDGNRIQSYIKSFVDTENVEFLFSVADASEMEIPALRIIKSEEINGFVAVASGTVLGDKPPAIRVVKPK